METVSFFAYPKVRKIIYLPLKRAWKLTASANMDFNMMVRSNSESKENSGGRGV